MAPSFNHMVIEAFPSAPLTYALKWRCRRLPTLNASTPTPFLTTLKTEVIVPLLLMAPSKSPKKGPSTSGMSDNIIIATVMIMLLQVPHPAKR